MAERAYFDWNATAPLSAPARAALTAALDLYGNPSSVHAEGRAARRLVEEARAQVAGLAGMDPAGVVFTSGGSEANAMALTPAIEGAGPPRDRLLVSAIEHPSVRAGGSFAADAIEEIAVTAAGIVDLDDLEGRLARGGNALVSVMLANNETGVVQPIREVADLVHQASGLLHVDAAQVPGRIEFDFKALGADLASLSAHKLGGPKGIGALLMRAGLHFPSPLIRGGGQERGLRAGTENVAGIAGFGAAAAAAQAGLATAAPRMRALRDRLEAGLRAILPELVIFGLAAPRLPNTSLFAASGMKAETAVIALDLDGVAVSSGAACSSGKVQPSHVLAAMGVEPSLAQGAIRASLGPATTEADVEKLLNAWNRLSKSLGKGRTGLAA
jgi:cysteine desulfurase